MRIKKDKPGFVKVCVSLNPEIYAAAKAGAQAAGVPFSTLLNNALQMLINRDNLKAAKARLVRLEKIAARFQETANKLAQEVDGLKLS